MTVGIPLRKRNLILPPRYGAFTGKTACKNKGFEGKFSLELKETAAPANIFFLK